MHYSSRFSNQILSFYICCPTKSRELKQPLLFYTELSREEMNIISNGFYLEVNCKYHGS